MSEKSAPELSAAAFRDLALQRLCEAGFGQGDRIVVHAYPSQLMVFDEIYDLGKFYLDLLLELVGPQGELIFPAFTYSYCRSRVFDVRGSPSKVSLLANACIRHRLGNRTVDPLFSYVFVGQREPDFLFSNVCFAWDHGVAGYAFSGNCKLLVLGVPFVFSLLHACEQRMRVPFRYFKTFTGVTVDAGERIRTEAYYYCRRMTPHSELDLKKSRLTFYRPLVQRGIIKYFQVGPLKCMGCRVRPILGAFAELITQDPYLMSRGPGLSRDALSKLAPDTETERFRLTYHRAVALG